ncbi:MAG TPA: SHOCT domain-containing protein [Longimicrobiales bacterium]
MSTAPAVVATPTPIATDDPRIASAVQELGSLLVPGETLEAVAVQRRIFALTHRRLVLAATSGRLLALTRGLFGGFQLVDVRWQDLKDVHLRVGMLGADLIVRALASQDLAVQESTAGGVLYQGLQKQPAEQLYRVCQANGQAWREKRRQRELEEMRARAGGVQIGSAAGASLGGEPNQDLVSRLERAKEMLAKGLISDSEYEAIKAKVIASM